MKHPPLRDPTLEQFSVLLSRGYSPQLAYREIFKKPDKGKARAFAANPRIQTRVRQLQEMGAEQAGITAAWYYDQLLDLLREEREQQKHAQANRTLELLGKAAQLLGPKSDEGPVQQLQVGTQVVIEMPSNGRE